MISGGKSLNSPDPIVRYCAKHTIRLHPLQQELQDVTIKKAPQSVMLGAPEILTIGSHFIQLIKGKRIIDIGTYTGASALAWALATPDDGKVFTLDIDHAHFRNFGLPLIETSPKILTKIVAIEGPALASLDNLLADGEEEKFDFAMIDADKTNYCNYYERCMRLLRPGGVLMVDNALWSGFVTENPGSTTTTKEIDDLNRKIHLDCRTNSFLLSCGDGLHIAFKK